ncbi:4197_t:CDS:1 [Acaulospora colombiana]|uniref:4197_t:CDS:1 n=1 Tax=Acaulospora colombiana TaxID=27376 RepID=A0ACA9K884_9GLOM|nr:4197_t:CDS:1 [Acaulospora colombiana]
MASVLPSLCIREILLDLDGDWATLHACALINRHWCLSSIQEIWRNPFCLDRAKESRHIRLITTYIKCLPRSYQEMMGVVATTPCAFNYFRFLSHLNPEKIRISIKLWAEANKNKLEDALFGILCQQFISHSSIESVHLASSRIVNIFELPGAETSLARIRKFECYGSSPELLTSAARISKDIYQFKLSLTSEMNFAAQLIRAQRKVRKVSIGCCEKGFHAIFDSIAMHAGSMVSLRLSSIDFRTPFSLNALDNFRGLEELEFDYCKSFSVTIGEFSPSSFTRINKLSVTMCKQFPTEFLTHVFSQSKERVRHVELIGIKHFREVIESCISNCRKMTKFRASIDASRGQCVIDLLKNCVMMEDVHLEDAKLVHNSFPSLFLIPSTIDGNEFLKELGKVMPSTVHTFRYNLNWNFDPESLKEFFDNWGIKRLRMLDFNLCNFISDEHLEVVCQCLGEGRLGMMILQGINVSERCIKEASKEIGNILCSEKF